MKWLGSIILLVLLSACMKKGSSVTVENAVDDYEVNLLFTKDNCKVYRFYDGYHRYFTNCTETMSSHSCGKGCVQHENVRSK